MQHFSESSDTQIGMHTCVLRCAAFRHSCSAVKARKMLASVLGMLMPYSQRQISLLAEMGKQFRPNRSCHMWLLALTSQSKLVMMISMPYTALHIILFCSIKCYTRPCYCTLGTSWIYRPCLSSPIFGVAPRIILAQSKPVVSKY